MTTLDKNFTSQLEIVQALERLAGVLGKRRIQPYYPAYPQAVALLRAIAEGNRKDELQNLALLETAGEIPKISEELYNPTFTDDAAYLDPAKYRFPTVIGENYLTMTPDPDTSCLVTYNLKEDGNVLAMIKNYIHLDVIDYSETSKMYPVIDTDSMGSRAFIVSGRLYSSPRPIDEVVSVGAVLGASYPLVVGYQEINNLDQIDSSGVVYGASYPLIVGYQYIDHTDEINANGFVLGASYPLIVNYITYTYPPEGINTSGAILGASRP